MNKNTLYILFLPIFLMLEGLHCVEIYKIRSQIQKSMKNTHVIGCSTNDMYSMAERRSRLGIRMNGMFLMQVRKLETTKPTWLLLMYDSEHNY